MAEITRERTGELVQNLFKILIANPEGLRARDAIEQLAGAVTLTPYEAGEYESTGTRRFDKIVRFATVDCAKAGWMQKQNGIWTITEDGIAAYKKFSNTGDLYREAARLYRIWKLGQPEKENETKEINLDEPSDKQTAVTYEQAQDQARAEIDQYLGALHPYEFQDLVAALVEAMGYYVSWIAPPGKDGGIDIIAHPDALGTKPPRIKVQVKRTSDKTTADGVRAFLGLVKANDVGLYVSLGGFTRDAEEVARNQEQTKITLIDSEKFRELWIDHYARLNDRARKRFTLSPIYFLTPVE